MPFTLCFNTLSQALAALALATTLPEAIPSTKNGQDGTASAQGGTASGGNNGNLRNTEGILRAGRALADRLLASASASKGTTGLIVRVPPADLSSLRDAQSRASFVSSSLGGHGLLNAMGRG